MVVEFTTTCAIVAYHHLNCEFEPHSCRGVLDKTLCDKVCQWLATGLWISLGTPISATKVVTDIFWTYDGSKVCVCSALHKTPLGHNVAYLYKYQWYYNNIVFHTIMGTVIHISRH
jgi:hypothetical protein